MRTWFFSFLLLSFLGGGVVGAQVESETNVFVEDVVETEVVTDVDLGVEDPGILPTSPFYFFKEIGRGFQRALTFNAASKTELELKIASEKAVEAKRVAEEDPSNERGIARALLNFQNAQERLQARLANLQNSSDNPNVDALLDRIAEKQIVHGKLFAELEMKHEIHQDRIKEIQSQTEDTLSDIAQKDTPERFQNRLENVLENGRGSSLKHLRSLEILDRLQDTDNVSDEVKNRLSELRSSLADRLGENVDRFVNEEEGEDRLRRVFEDLPGDSLRRTVILEELRGRVSDRAANAIGEARIRLDERIDDGEDITDDVRARIARIEGQIEKIDVRIREAGDKVPQAVLSLLDRAKNNLDNAKTALSEGNTREAFGFARAAEAIILNIFNLFERGIDVIERAPELLDRVRDRLQDVRPKRPIQRDEQNDGSVACTLEFAPVCGTDGKTYSNKCFLEQAVGVSIATEGECSTDESGMDSSVEGSGSLELRSEF